MINHKDNFSEKIGTFYDNLNKKSEFKTYSDWKWFRTKSSISQFNQTKASIIKSIQEKNFNSALEIGPGDGIWTELLSHHCKKIDAIDISKEMLKMAKKRFAGTQNIKFIEGDFLKLNLPESKYDLVYSIRCFEYIPEKDKAIKKFMRLLKKDGKLLLITKNPHFLSIKMRDKEIHSKQIDILKLKSKLEENGFQVLKIYPAVFGKGFHFPLFRYFSQKFHSKLIDRNFSINLMTKYLSESFIIYAKK
ncbi:MAG: class I SAM-dependent methyltransferase [Nanoarchaeota archaeon]